MSKKFYHIFLLNIKIAVKTSESLSIWWLQAQMARQAEQDPTNLYIANLPHTIKENDLETLFNPYGQAGVYIL